MKRKTIITILPKNRDKQILLLARAIRLLDTGDAVGCPKFAMGTVDAELDALAMTRKETSKTE